MLLNEVMDVILDELDHFEDGPWYGDRALAVADGLARAEFDNEALRAVGEAIGRSGRANLDSLLR